MIKYDLQTCGGHKILLDCSMDMIMLQWIKQGGECANESDIY